MGDWPGSMLGFRVAFRSGGGFAARGEGDVHAGDLLQLFDQRALSRCWLRWVS